MKLGDIKIEALKIMSVSYGENLTLDNISNFENDENFSAYLVKMNGSINRCFADLERKRITPIKVKILTREDATERAGSLEFDLSALDILDFVRLAREDARGNRNSHFSAYEYVPEEKRLITRKIGAEECFYLSYRQKMKYLEGTEDYDYEIDLPETIATIIPFYIKGDLYREDEPSEAAEARNWYEAATEDIINGESSHGEVVSVFSLNNL